MTAADEEGGLSPSRRRDELRRLRRLQRRLCCDPLLPRVPRGAGSPTACRSAGLTAATSKEQQPPGTAAASRRQKEWPDTRLPLSFRRRMAGIVIVVAVILLLMGVTLKDPRKLAQLEPCPDDWLYYKKKCYYNSEGVADWNSSQESCSRYGASLAVIDSHQELNFIMYRLRVTDFWIGLRRKGGRFFWVNGESFDTNLFHVNITNDGNCVSIDSSIISTRKCSSLRNRLCTIVSLMPRQTLNRGQLAVQIQSLSPQEVGIQNSESP